MAVMTVRTRKMFDHYTANRQRWIMLAQRKREARGYYFGKGGPWMWVVAAVCVAYIAWRMFG